MTVRTGRSASAHNPQIVRVRDLTLKMKGHRCAECVASEVFAQAKRGCPSSRAMQFKRKYAASEQIDVFKILPQNQVFDYMH